MMKKIKTYLLLILLLFVSKSILSLTNMEKHKLFYSAKNIIVVNNNDGARLLESNNVFHDYVEKYWQGNDSASFRYFVGALKTFNFGNKHLDNSILELEDIDINNTLFVEFFSGSFAKVRLYYLNKKKKFIALFCCDNFLPVEPIQLPYSNLTDIPTAKKDSNESGKISLRPNHRVHIFRSTEKISELTISISLNTIKTYIDLLMLSKSNRKKRYRELTSLAPLRKETLSVSITSFDKEEGISRNEFESSYPYKYSIFSTVSSVEQFNQDSSRYYLFPISSLSMTATGTPGVSSMDYRNSSFHSLVIYDKKNKIFIKVSGRFIDRKTMNFLKKNSR